MARKYANIANELNRLVRRAQRPRAENMIKAAIEKARQRAEMGLNVAYYDVDRSMPDSLIDTVIEGLESRGLVAEHNMSTNTIDISW